MFDQLGTAIGLLPGESGESVEKQNQFAYEVTGREWAEDWVDPDRHVLPGALESIPVGPYLAAIVTSVDRTRLNGHDVVRLMQAEARLENSLAAQKLASAAEVAHCPPGGPDSPVERDQGEIEYAAVEIAAALTLTRRASEALMDRALWLSSVGRRVAEMWDNGRISEVKTREFDRHLSHLDADTVESVLDATLEEAEGLTTGQLRHRVSKQVMIEDPDGAKSSFHEGLEERKVVSQANPDFTGCLHVCSADPRLIASASRHVDRIARNLKDMEGEERSLDQLRADVALDLLQGKSFDSEQGNARGGVWLSVPLETLVGLTDLPGKLGGYGPVIADIARQIALQQVDGEWTWTVTDRGDVLATGTTRYRPTAAQKRRARADYQTCVAPGCRMPAYQCDLDHRDPYSRCHRTHNSNLAPLCRHHHLMRHHSQWRYRRLADRSHEWTSPLGHSYVKERDPPD
jgi:hypothetical protein